MNNAIEIKPGRYQPLREYDGQRVVTFKDIDTVHERPKGTARRNFNINKEHFIEGIDFMVVKPSDIQVDEFRTAGIEANNFGTTLLTETGYLMLVKSFTDDLAWEVQRALITGYFRAKDKELLPQVPNRPLTPDDYMRAASIMAGCKNERLPWVLDLLRKGGFDMPEVEGYNITKRRYTTAEKEQLASEAVESMQTIIDDGSTVTELAEKLGIAKGQVSRYLNGIIKPLPDRARQIITIITNIDDTEE